MSRLYLRLFVLIGGLFLILTSTMVAFIYSSDSHQVEAMGVHWAQALSQVAALAVETALRDPDPQAVDEVLQRLRQVDAFRQVELYRNEGPSAAGSAPPPTGLIPERPIRWIADGSPLRVRVLTPLRDEQQPGALFTEITLTPFDRILAWRRNVLLVVILSGAFTLALLTLYGLRVTVLQPLQAIRQGVRRLAQGQLDYRLTLDTGDEFQELAEAFNHMARQLQRSYESLRESQARIQAALEASRNPIWISDAQRRIVMVNRALERLVGRPREALLGRTCRYLFNVCLPDGQSVCDFACPLAGPVPREERITGYMPTASGRLAWVEITHGYVRDEQGRITDVIHIVHDLSEYKELERLKDEFLSLVSHELRTPLHHIKGFATSLLQTDVTWDPETQRDFLESINQEVDRLTDLVDKILHLSRLRAGALPMHKQWWAVQDVLDAALRHCRHLLQRDVVVECHDDLPPVWMDGREVETVLRNLLENAAKFSPPEAPIRLGVRYEPDEDRVHFWVQDQGPGIPPEERERIFEHFYRGRARSHSPGTGLGLAICKRIVEAHGGRIWVESDGHGACFHFTLPVRPAEQEPTPVPPGNGHAQDARAGGG